MALEIEQQVVGVQTWASWVTPVKRLVMRPLVRVLKRLVAGVQCGRLDLVLPDGHHLVGQGALAGPEVTLTLHRWRALLRIVLRSDIGLAEAYRDGEWSASDLTALLQLIQRNESAWGGLPAARWTQRLLLQRFHRQRDNSQRGSRRNIAFHYDMGNAFYAKWLDADLVYSSGIYRDAQTTLEEAQAAKLDRIAELLALTEQGASVLEIGCGWGALACLLAQRSKATVTGITLSSEQLTHAQARVQREGRSAQMDLRLQDYRAATGQYDRIVSIEMIEAVGERHWPTYFAAVRDRLKPGGRAVIQAITIGDAYFEHYRNNVDFIQRFIFPGGMLPSPGALRREAERAGLELQHEETFGLSYAATLADWRARFLQNWESIVPLGFDRAFKRLWEYYLCYSEAGFREARVDVGLYVLVRPDASH